MKLLQWGPFSVQLFIIESTLSKHIEKKKLTPPCAVEGLIWQPSLLRDRDAQSKRALWMAVEEEVHAHSQELFPKLFAQEQFKQTLNQRNN